MIIPDEIMIGAIPIRIEKSSINNEEPGAMGRAIESRQLIRINSNMPKEMQEKIFFHELIHMILDILSLHDVIDNGVHESFIDSVSLVLHQVISQLTSPKIDNNINSIVLQNPIPNRNGADGGEQYVGGPRLNTDGTEYTGD